MLLVTIVYLAFFFGLAMSDRSCSRPREPAPVEREFYARFYLIRSFPELGIICGETDTIRRSGGIDSNAFSENYQAICSMRGFKPLIERIIKINNLPQEVCGHSYEGFRLSLANDLVDRTGKVVIRSEHKECYERIFASGDFQSLTDGQSNDQVSKQLSAAAKQMERQGKSPIACVLGRVKDSFKQLRRKTKTLVGAGSILLIGSIVGIVFVLLSSVSLGTLPALLLVFAIFFTGALGGAGLIAAAKVRANACPDFTLSLSRKTE